MRFGIKREPDIGTMQGLLGNRKSEIEFIEKGEHEGAYDAEAYDEAAFDVGYIIYDKRIVKA